MDEVPIHLHIEPLEEGGFLGTSPDVPGLVVEGETIAEVVEFAKDCTRMIIESCIEHGDPLPPAFANRPKRPAVMDLVIPIEAA